MSKTYRDLHTLPSPRPRTAPPPPVLRLVRVCRDCGEEFRTVAAHVERCPICHRTNRRMVSA